MVEDGDLFGSEDGASEDDWGAPVEASASLPPPPQPIKTALTREQSAEEGRVLLGLALSGGDDDDDDDEICGSATTTGSGPRKTAPVAPLHFPFNGDLNDQGLFAPGPRHGRGIFYWLGTNGGTEPWRNPHEAGRVRVTRSSGTLRKASLAVGDRVFGGSISATGAGGGTSAAGSSFGEACPATTGLLIRHQ